MQVTFLVFLVFLFVQYFCKEQESQITFTVYGIKECILPCVPALGSYTFYIEGEFSSTPSFIDTLTLNLLQPLNAQAICNPFGKTSYSNGVLQCEINLCDYKIDGNILLQLDVPKDSIYIFKNWEQTIGVSPGTSNKVDNTTCLPEAKAIFNVTNIEKNGCNGNKNVLKLNGKWDKEVDNIKFDLKIDGHSKKAYCSYVKGKEYVTCQLEGYGNIKINEKYCKSTILEIYLISESEHSIHVDECSDGKLIGINSIIFYLLIISLFI